MRFSSRHIAEVTVAEDANGKVDTVYRKFKITARAAAQRFGEENLPTQMVKDLKNDPHKEHDLIHVVYPRGKQKAR